MSEEPSLFSSGGSKTSRYGPYLLVGLLVFFSCALFTSGHLMSPDGELLYRQSESLALRGSLSVTPIEYDDPEMRAQIAPEDTFATVLGAGGKFYVQYLPLQSVLSVPLVWLGRITEPLFAQWFYSTMDPIPTHYLSDVGGTWRRAVTVVLFNPIVTALTAIILMRLALLLTAGNRRAAFWTAIAYGLATFALAHSRTYFTEPLAGLMALVALDQLIRWFWTPLTTETGRRRLIQMIVVGTALAAAIWTRMDSPLLAAGIGLSLVAAGEWKRRREDAYGQSPGRFPFRDYAVSGGIVVFSYFALMFFNAWRFGGSVSLFGGGYSDQAEGIQLSTPLLIGLHGFLMSPGKGLFFFSPALVLAVWGWCRRPKPLWWAAAIMLIAYLPFTLLQLKWQNWDGGWCWGPRHIYQLHAPLMLGAAFIFCECFSMIRSALIKIVLVVGFSVNIFGSLQSPIDFYREMYSSVRDGEYYNVAWRPAEWVTIYQDFEISPHNPVLRTSHPISQASTLPAPMVDSLYLPQHTQWAGYPRMLSLGYFDWWLGSLIIPDKEEMPAIQDGGIGN